ncbi:hypothetical protein RhiirA1_427739 [Rhizophagus irregularis]|uniref:SET domain-containing protein n=5 Tax=Rhizophagus irregularis TaxID=588596 RepID=A0A2I1F4N9_9GLOM|nr:hypothetical protein GLOIN_2v1502738 [Rhizophagus irregularis DAOM 181602=DAOM 197198]EXX54837.1 hypothetical protein RirG_230800 [Rhizophagus irregularis DAOM 197198w]PKC58406.1 hypothetical protein RhiirA1_427739 [Rhizophagus irregularis]PKY29333.1 hypothetical protein RhiirB3_417910 [Rhizophagus irregularis]POG81805.1 hypothetical protein GLOIN_2v1502738 [Rhizophagus irregularis DAOM 181602=DAOM 197198]UZO07460.1 hypothetical protein OCT59_027744 [Rhizophagus irregularis]|eukprot:XP_025188671.1 hypothetical protein GLOIN_2v1502738 [Rhizophagus irregularis DAOM 181602=DAOM 197198]
MVKNNNKGTGPSDDSSSKSSGFALTITPFTGLTLLALLVAVLFSWDQYRGGDLAVCDLIKPDYNDRTEWITMPDHRNKEEYLKYEPGTFVYRHIYMENFEEVFGVKPIYFPIIDDDISPYLAKHNLRARLLNSTDINQSTVQALLRESDNYIPQVEKIKYEVGNGTFVDDGGIYIRWINDIVRYGMYASKTFQRRDILGVYSGLVTRQLTDLEYAWEFNYLVDVKDEEDKKIRVCIDAKHMGNYMRFANHRDTNQNGDQLYVVYNDLWHVLYIAQAEIKLHEQIFVNYGQGYWENKKKYDF